jgi:hypothetical protein
MQSYPSLKKKLEDEETSLKPRQGHTSASSLDLRKVATSVQPVLLVDVPPQEESVVRDTGGLRRRYSAGNMRDAHSEESENEHKHDDTDDHDDNVFSMDDDTPSSEIVSELQAVKSVVPTYAQARQNWAERCYEIERSKRISHQSSQEGLGNIPAIVSEDQGSTRTEWFLLIENLTKNMIRPCVLDLKMGTRQYGYLSPHQN